MSSGSTSAARTRDRAQCRREDVHPGVGANPAATPLRAGRAVRHTHDYRRHGVVDLFAALNIATAKVTHAFSASHTAGDFLRFMKKVARTYPNQDSTPCSITPPHITLRKSAPGW